MKSTMAPLETGHRSGSEQSLAYVPMRPGEAASTLALSVGVGCRRDRGPSPMLSGSTAASLYFRDEHVRDGLFGIIVDGLTSLFKMNCLDSLAPHLVNEYEKLLCEHFADPVRSRLKHLVPEIGPFHTELPFAQAFSIYNQKYCITKRRFIPPTFHEVRHIMNIAQVMAVREHLRLVTFDGDETLYPDGKNFEDLQTASYITHLLKRGVYVAVVTAAGYAYQVDKYESRLAGLLAHFKKQSLKPKIVGRFFLFGGESNYLLRCGEDYHLHPVPERMWSGHVSEALAFHLQNSEGTTVQRVLDAAEAAMRLAIEELALRATIVRKARAVGLVPGGPEGKARKPTGSGMNSLKPEILEEVVLRVRDSVYSADVPIPFCAFNGGYDVWVDIGNKAEGVAVLQSFLKARPHQCLHIGDQFGSSGNDLAARDVAPTLWICSPEETKAVLRSLLRQMRYATLLTKKKTALLPTTSNLAATQWPPMSVESQYYLEPTDCMVGAHEAMKEFSGSSDVEDEERERDEDLVLLTAEGPDELSS